jgi:Domain of unknown function (DUF834).
MIFRRFNLLEKNGKRKGDDDVGMTSPMVPARVSDLAVARMVGREFGGHLHVEDDETNPMVFTKAPNDNRRRPATTQEAAAARLNGGDGSPVAGGEEGRAAGLPHSTAHLLAAAASGGDGGGGAAARLEKAGGGGELNTHGGDATAHERAREMGQTKEDDEVVLFIALD